MDTRHEPEPRVDRSRLELLALLGSAGAAAACSPPSPQMMGQDTVDAITPSPKDTKSRAPLKPLTREELKSVGLDKEGGEGGGGGDGGGH